MIVIREQLPARRYVVRRVPDRAAFLTVLVDPMGPVNVYVVDGANLVKFEQGQEFEHFGPGMIRSLYSSVLQLPREDEWHVIIENPLSEETFVHDAVA